MIHFKIIVLLLLIVTIKLGIIISITSLKYLQNQIPMDTACWLLAIGRGRGRNAEDTNLCNPDEEYSNNKCYFKCPINLIGKGSVCWGKCNYNEYQKCGAICLRNNQDCNGKIKEYVENMIEKVESFVDKNDHLDEINIEILSDYFTFPKCK